MGYDENGIPLYDEPEYPLLDRPCKDRWDTYHMLRVIGLLQGDYRILFWPYDYSSVKGGRIHRWILG